MRRLLIALAVLSIPLVALFFTPFSSSFFNERLKSAWFEATGLEMQFEKSVVFLANRRFEIEGVRFVDPGTSETLYAVESVDVAWHWRLAGIPIEVDTVTIRMPEAAVLDMDASYRLRPQGRLGNFIEVLAHLSEQSALQPADQEREFPIPEIRVRGAGLQILASEGETRGEILAGIDSMSLDVRVRDDNWHVTLRGNLSSENTDKDDARVALEIASFDKAAGRYRFAFHAERLGFSPFFRLAVDTGPFQLYANGLSLQGTIDIGQADWVGGQVDSLSVQSLLVNLPVFDFHIPGAQLEGRGDWRFDYESARLEVREFALDLLESRLQGEGELFFTDDMVFGLRVRDSRLSPLWLNLSQTLFSHFLPASANILEGELLPDLNITGNRTGLDWNTSRLAVRGNDLKMEVPQYNGGIVGPVTFEADLTSETLRLPLLAIQMDEDRLRFEEVSASLLGKTWAEGLSLDAQWSLDADMDSLLKRVQSYGALKNMELSGRVDGDGALKGNWHPPRPDASAPTTHWALSLREHLEPLLEQMQLSGSLRIQDAGGIHHLFPAPIRGVSGTLEMADNTLTATDLTGSMLGSEVHFSARLEGTNQFWINPQMRFDFQGDIALKDAEEILKSEVLETSWPGEYRREILKHLRPRGAVQVDLHVNGPLLNPLELRPEGSISASGIAVDIISSFSSGLLIVDSMRLDIQPQQFELTRLDGRLRDIDFKSSATLDQEGMRLSVRIDTPFQSVQAAFPKAFLYAPTVGGHLLLDGRASAALRADGIAPGMARPRTPFELLAGLMRRLPEEKGEGFAADCVESIGQCFDYDFGATVDVTDGVFEHAFMPNMVTDINGRLELFPMGFRTVGFCETTWGSSQAGVTSATLTFEPTPQIFAPDPAPATLKIRFVSSTPELHMDEWIAPWGPGRMRPREERRDAPVERAPEGRYDYRQRDQYPMMSDITGYIMADKLYFRRFEFNNASTLLETQYLRNRDSLLAFKDTKADGYEGNIECDIAFYFPRAAKLEWQWQALFNDVNVQPLLTAVYGKDATITGKLDAWLDMRAVGGNQESFVGQGALKLIDSEFMDFPIFDILGRLLNIKGLSKASFSNMEGDFTIAQGWIWIQRLILDGVFFDFAALGRATLAGDLDLTVAYIPLGILQDVPLLNYVPRIFSSVTDRLLKVYIGGTVSDPKARMLAPSFSVTQASLPEDAGPRPPVQLMDPITPQVQEAFSKDDGIENLD